MESISFAAIAYWIVLYSGFLVGFLSLKSTKLKLRFPIFTLGFLSILWICLLIQLHVPGALELMQRDISLVFQGQVWRLFTPLFFQDGALAGGILNTINLLLIGSVAETMLGRRQWLVVAFIGGMLTEMIGALWDPIGAGNSIINFALAAGIIASVINKHTRCQTMYIIIFSLGVIFLTIAKDIHAIAAVIGLCLVLFQIRRAHATA